MDIIEKRTGLKGIFAKKEDRKLLYFHRYYLGRRSVTPRYLADVLDVKLEVLKRKLHFFEEMGLIARAAPDDGDGCYSFIPLKDRSLAELLEEFHNNRRADYEDMAKVFSAAEIRLFLGSKTKGGKTG